MYPMHLSLLNTSKDEGIRTEWHSKDFVRQPKTHPIRFYLLMSTRKAKGAQRLLHRRQAIWHAQRQTEESDNTARSD